MKVINVSTEKLNPSRYNPRRISESMMGKLVGNIEEFGLVKPLVINKDFTIIGGHQRYKVAKKLGFTEIPCVVVDLSKEKEKVLNLSLNKIQGFFDEFKLAEVIGEIDDYGLLEKTGFEKTELQLLQELLDVDVDYLTKDDEIEEMIKKDKVYQIRLLFKEEDKELYYKLAERFKGKDSFEKTNSLLNYLKEKNHGN